MTALESPLRQPAGAAPDVATGRGPSWLDEWLMCNGADLVAWRRHIHSHPELAFHELGTTALIAEQLAAAGLTPTLLPRGTGLICDIGTGSRCVALRA
ncbi:MAG: amidohydrolase, partial [Pseudonocardiaceae bacterium]